jgi:hypothetical protein
MIGYHTLIFPESEINRGGGTEYRHEAPILEECPDGSVQAHTDMPGVTQDLVTVKVRKASVKSQFPGRLEVVIRGTRADRPLTPLPHYTQWRFYVPTESPLNGKKVTTSLTNGVMTIKFPIK